ncbi:MAG: serine/threonine protein kinase [Oscillospiraceae bacterium]|nr:serine/threonine protein kinase [Oscillospiraceae bacterium]
MDEVRYCPYCMTPVKENGVCPACGLTEGSYVPAPHHLLPGTVLQDRYLIGRVLGEGGFGITYVGRDTRLGLKIAVKEYYPVGNAARNNQESVTVTSSSRTTGTYEKGKSKFLQEAMTMGKLEKEPQIVGVKDFFQENNTAYIVMEYIEGTTLKELTAQRGGRIPADELFEMIKPMFGAIQHMHDLGLIHRDISPDNLMLENGDIKLLDFGCAKDVTDSSQVNQQTQTLILKHGYSPFEQYQMSSNQGPWTDVYAFGASIYYCLTGNPPPRSTDRIMGDNIVPPHKLGIKITERQEDALMKALAVRPVDRFSSMNQFQGALYGNTVETVVSEKAQKKGQIRKPKQKKTAPAMGLTVREKLFDNPEEEPEEVSEETEPAKDPDRILTAEEKPLFVTDEIVVPKDKLEEKKKSGNKTVIIAVVAIILVIALAVTGIVWAIVGSNSSNNNSDSDTSGYLTEKWFKIEGVAIDSYHEDGASYDASTRTIEYTEAKAATGWAFDEGATLDYIEVNLSERNVGVNLVVNYSDGTLTQTGYKFTNTMTLDIDSGKTVSSIVLRCGEDTGTVVISSVRTNAEDDEEEVIVAEESFTEWSIDVDVTVLTFGEGSGVIEESETELLEEFYAAVNQDGAYVAVTADSADIKLAMNIGLVGWQYVEKCTAVRNDDGTYTTYFECQDILDLVSDLGLTLEDIRCVYIDSLTWEEKIHVTKIEVVDEAFFFPMNIDITGGEGEVWYEVYAYGDEVSAQLIVPSPYHQLKTLSITDIDGNVVDYTINYFGCDSYDWIGEVIHYDFTFIMPVYGANISVELYDPTEELSLATIESHEGYPSELDVLKIDEADFTDEDLYLCIYYDNQETYWSDYVGVINVGDWDGDYAQVYIVMAHDCGYEYIPLTVLKQRAEELGYDVSDGFFFWIGVEDKDIVSVDLATTGTVETVLYSEKMTDSDMLDFLQDYDFTDPELYLYIYYDLLDDDYIGWGPVGISTPNWDIIIGGSNGRFLGADESGLITVSLVEIKEAFEDAGFDVSDGVLLNWWADDNNNENDHYANLTGVAVVRVTG